MRGRGGGYFGIRIMSWKDVQGLKMRWAYVGLSRVNPDSSQHPPCPTCFSLIFVAIFSTGMSEYINMMLTLTKSTCSRFGLAVER